MYDWVTSMAILFLTHPGILLTLEPPESVGVYGYWLRGIWQAAWVLVMQSFSEGPSRVTAQTVYYGILLLWVVIRSQIALKAASSRI